MIGPYIKWKEEFMIFAGLKRRFENLYNKKYNKLYVTKNQLPSSAWAKVFFFGVMYI